MAHISGMSDPVKSCIQQVKLVHLTQVWRHIPVNSDMIHILRGRKQLKEFNHVRTPARYILRQLFQYRSNTLN